VTFINKASARNDLSSAKLVEPEQNELTKSDKQRFYERYPYLAEIKDPVWEQSIETARKMKIPINFAVYDGGSRCDSFVLLLNGVVRVYYVAPDGREITLYRVSPGDLCVLSLAGLFNNRQYNVIAKTETDVVAMAISEEQFRRSLGQSEKFRDFVLSTLSERLCDLMCLVQDTVFQTIQVRLACLLVRSFAISDNDSLHTTHQSLAHEIGTTREVVSRILKEFEHRKCIKISRGTIDLISFNVLEEFARSPNM